MKQKYYIQDDTRVLLTLHSETDMTEAWEALNNPEEWNDLEKARYGKIKPVGQLVLLMVLAEAKFYSVKVDL